MYQKFIGILALYNGLTASLLRQLTYSTTRFGIYETIKKRVKSDAFYTKVAIAAVAGCAGGFVGTPADMVNVRMQNDMKLPPEQRRKYVFYDNKIVQCRIKCTGKYRLIAL